MTHHRRSATADQPAPATSVRFAGAARVLAPVVRQRGLDAPSWRSPPRLTQADRTLRRRPDGSSVVAVRVRGRPWPAVLADMIEGVVVANQLAGPEADATRTALWAAVERDARREERPVDRRASPSRRMAGAAPAAAERRTERRDGRRRSSADRPSSDRAEAA